MLTNADHIMAMIESTGLHDNVQGGPKKLHISIFGRLTPE